MKRPLVLASIFVTVCVVGGCQSDSSVKGVVTLDGTPVEGASVIFMTEDGKTTYSGETDAKGNFTLTDFRQKTSIPSGTYKVIVTKNPPAGNINMDPSNPESMKVMQKEAAEHAGGQPGIGKGAGPAPIKKDGPGSSKSLLPAVYASLNTTPITVKLPADKSPIPIELQSK